MLNYILLIEPKTITTRLAKLNMLLIVLFCLFSCSHNLCAQYSDVLVQNFSLKDGLPSATIYAVDQDSKGNIWVATQAGVTKFNSHSFQTLTAENGLYFNEVVYLKIDSKDRIWLNTSGPISYIEHDTVYHVPNFPSPNFSWNFHVYEDAEGFIWIVNARQLICLDGETLEPISLEDERLATPQFFKILGEANGCLLIGDPSGPIYKIKNRKIVDAFEIKDEVEFGSLKNWQYDFKWPYLFLYKKNKILKYHLESQELSSVLKVEKQINRMVVLEDHLLIFLPDKGLLDVILDEEGQSINKSSLLLDHIISDPFIDEQSNLWVSTFKSGLYLLRPRAKSIIDYKAFDSLLDTPIESVVKDSFGKIWLGGQNQTLYSFDGSKMKKFKAEELNSIGVNRILDIDVLGKDHLLLSTDNGLLEFKDETFKHLYKSSVKNLAVKNNMMIANTYFCTFKAPLDYFVSRSYTMDDSHIKQDPALEIIKLSRSYASEIDEEGNIWFGDEGIGLVKITKSDTIYYRDYTNKLNCSIKDILCINPRLTAVSTSGEGVVLISNDTIFFFLDKENGLSSSVCSELEFYNDKLYIATNSGLSIVDFDDSLTNYTIEIFDWTQGLLTDEINDLMVSNDTIYLMTAKGPVLIDQTKRESIPLKEFHPVTIDAVRVNNKPLSKLEDLSFSHIENDIIIDYSAINFNNPYQMLYAYKMDGVDDDWIYTRSRQTHYSNLKPGKYNFQVALVANDKELFENNSSLQFEISNHFFNSNLFRFILITLVGLLLIGSLFAFDANRKKVILAQLVDEKTDEVNSKIAALANANLKLEESNKTLKNYAHITSHDLKSPLRSVGSFIQLLEKKNQDKFDQKDVEYLKFVKEGVSRMSGTIDDILLYSTLEKSEPTALVNSKDVLDDALADLSHLIEERKVKIVIEGEFQFMETHYFRMKQLFQNLIENGIKYNNSEMPIIKIISSKTRTNHLISIEDNGIGIDEKYFDKIFDMFQRLHNQDAYKGTGIGLALCKKIVESYGGKIKVLSLEQGTRFALSFPISKTN